MDGNKTVRAVGELFGVQPGRVLSLRGKWVENAKYGRGFQVESYTEVPPDSTRAVINYLSSHFKGIGEKTARKIVEHLGADALTIIQNAPEKLETIPGIGKKLRRTIEMRMRENVQDKETLLFLESLGLGPRLIRRIQKQYGNKCKQLICENPYRLICEIKGIGFLSADQIAGNLGIPSDSPVRLDAGLIFELTSVREEGGCGLPEQVLLDRTARRLGVSGSLLLPRVAHLIREKKIVRYDESFSETGQSVIVSADLDRVENAVARHFVRLIRSKTVHLSADIDRLIRDFELETGIRLDPIQKHAVHEIVHSPVTVLTGGPGTGKTTLVQALLRVFSTLEIRVAAPTGRAAKRLSETTKFPATTIHRLLDFDAFSGKFKFNSEQQLSADIVIIDETSMLDIFLANSLLEAIRDSCRVVFVGDADQLPSVGPGKVLSDMIQSGICNVIRLEKIFRQADSSLIVQNAHRIIRGRMPIFPAAGAEKDFYFIRRTTPGDILETLLTLPHRLAQKIGIDAIDDVQVLCPMYRGILGVDNLNIRLQRLFFPDGGAGRNDSVPASENLFAEELSGKTQPFHPGDKVMQIKNNYDLEVFNGDIGRVVASGKYGAALSVRFPDRLVHYSMKQVDQLTLAFACSIHKSQGSEYPAVIIPLHTQHYMMLRRNLIYTAITRGRRMVVIVGSPEALRLAVKNHRSAKRYTLLNTKIRFYYSGNFRR